LSSADETFGPAATPPSRQPEELLGRRVRFRGLVGRVEEVDVVSTPHVVILTRDGTLLRLAAPEWDELEVLR
jgi:hypothetical protein